MSSGEWQVALILFSAGMAWGLLAVVVASWLTWRIARSRTGDKSEGFFRDPKGEAFTIQDGIDQVEGFPADTEPTREEQDVLKRTERFLSVLSGGAQ